MRRPGAREEAEKLQQRNLGEHEPNADQREVQRSQQDQAAGSGFRSFAKRQHDREYHRQDGNHEDQHQRYRGHQIAAQHALAELVVEKLADCLRYVAKAELIEEKWSVVRRDRRSRNAAPAARSRLTRSLAATTLRSTSNWGARPARPAPESRGAGFPLEDEPFGSEGCLQQNQSGNVICPRHEYMIAGVGDPSVNHRRQRQHDHATGLR